ncbi:MAG: hypothetical protein U1C58_06150 [Flavobacteriaceae bacterium]|nr:hypothetical protein [Flavobacteriaceae bacterium]MDZ4147846.1 hypothetical protein [Flavobacteriaceae bacterium]
MQVSEEWLEAEIKKQNDWLQTNSPAHFDYKQTQSRRNFYVNKVIEMNENELSTINI